MNLYFIEGSWPQAKSKIKEQWGGLDVDNLVVLIGRDEAEGEVPDLESLFDCELQN